MLTKAHALLLDFLSGPVVRNDEVFSSLLCSIDERPDCLLFITDISSRKLNYIHPSCERWFGLTAEEFVETGPDLIYQITDEASIPDVIRRQIAYTQHAKAAGFNPEEVIIDECPALMKNKFGEKTECICLIVVLTYTPEADMEYMVSVLVKRSAAESVDIVRHTLRRLKERHNAVYRHRPFRERTTEPHLIHVTTTRYDKMITPRELQVIQLLSQGLVTKEIAASLGISYHTAETYRKRLLGKFEAKNVAELIKKASKVYWLE